MLQIIGTVRSCFREKMGTPRQSHLVPGSKATLAIKKKFLPEHSLRGLEGFSHVWLIYYFHLNTNKKFRPMVHPPRLQGKKMGLFATRTPHRPSPLGLSLARLEKIEKGTLHLSGIDLVDGTPVLDIKPYLPVSDHAPKAKGGWSARRAFPVLRVVFSPEALNDIRKLETRGRKGFKRLLSDILRQDLRNARDRYQNREGKVLGFFLYDHNILYKVNGKIARVLRVEIGGLFEKEGKGLPDELDLTLKT